MNDPRCIWGAVVVAAGSGTRFGGDVPKQFTGLLGVKVIDLSIDLFRGVARHIVVVVPEDGTFLKWWTPPGDVVTVHGGERRQDSVQNGLKELMKLGATHVLVHDGARPLVDRECIERIMEETIRSGACLPCVPVGDTVKRVSDGHVAGTVDRSGLYLAQTPQGFRAEILADALEAADSVTDEAAAVEAMGLPVSVVPGSVKNIKLTTPGDRDVLRSLMSGGETVTAIGIDFHPFAHERPLVLCGCRLSDTDGLLGNSDGDVVLHAVADSILSGARAGDIGVLFPPDDPRWKGADSSLLLTMSSEKIRGEGWRIRRLDITVIGERPRISPLRDMFIRRLAGILSLGEECIWIKGTTTNTIGELANGKGLGCFVLCELVRMSE